MASNQREAYLRIVEARHDIGGRFTNVKRISPTGGQGAFSLVFVATDHTTGKPAALKFYNPDQASDTYRFGCFRREAELLTQLAGQPDIIRLVSPASQLDETLATAQAFP